METLARDLLPTQPTVRDFRRLGAVVTTARYRIDPECDWNQEDLAETLYENQDGLPFPILARAAMQAARYPGIKTPAGIGRYVSGLVQA
jgi:hypothetical protein